MKKVTVIILLAVFSATVYSQEPNRQLQQLVQYMKELGFGLYYEQTNYRTIGVQHKWRVGLYANKKISADESLSEEQGKQVSTSYDDYMARQWQKIELAVDSVRLAFARMSKESSSSYLFENHKDSTDTVKYALAFAGFDGRVPFLYENKKYNKVEFFGVREAASFKYDRYFDSQRQSFVKKGSLEHVYVTDSDKDLKDFDVAVFEALIQPVIKSLLSLKGAKALPVYWQHDAGYKDVNGDGKFSTNHIRGGSVNGYGLTTGISYFIPDKYRSEAEELFRQLNSLALAYVNQHPEQRYVYSHSTSFPQSALLYIVCGVRGDHDDTYCLESSRDEDGFYILSLTTKGDMWVPNDWSKLKSWINGKKVYLKGREPKKEKK